MSQELLVESRSRLAPFLISVFSCSTAFADIEALSVNTLSPEDACRQIEGASISAELIGLPTSGAGIHSTEMVLGSDVGNIDGNFCKVLGAIRPVTNNAPDINFQVNLPTDWNGKALQFGGGGFNGSLVTGLEHYRRQPTSEDTPLARGYVTFGSDSGHQSSAPFDGRFLLNDEALRNYGHEQIKKTTDVAHLLIKARYGREAAYTYFIGASQGGHEAFDAAQRYPDDYDGVVAAYPAHNVVMLHLSANVYARALHANNGASWINPAKVTAFTNAVYDVCDDLDGAADGIVSNVPACQAATSGFKRFDAENPIRCDDGADTGNDCLSDAQIEALIVMDTPLDIGFSIFPDDEGNSVFPKWTPFEGSTFFDGGFPNLGGEGPHQALQYLPGDATPRYAIARDVTLDTMNDFEPKQWAGRISDLAHLISANSVNLDAFRQNGGKLIFFHGTVDDFIPSYSSIEYYERLRKRYDSAALDDFVRFYLIPGMGHVTGPFAAHLPTLDRLEDWVEKGIAPGELTAVDENEATAGRTRPVCSYPKWPKYVGSGDLNVAESFTCVDP